MKGSEILIKTLIKEGVDTVFGYPGSSVLEIYDALYRHPEIRHILTSHEQGAAHAADGYARSTGRVGVCLATSGPGATNLVTGIATAYMDSVPMVAITGNVSNSLLGKDSFQEVDIAGITMPITKHNFIVKDVKDLEKTVSRAFEIAGSGRPGPVLVDITTDAISAEYEFENLEINDKTEYNRFSVEELKTAAKLVNASKKPLIYAGGGAVKSGASDCLKKLAEILNAPVCDSLMGKGAFPGNDGKYIGMLGIHGTDKAREAVRECDLLIAVGVRFSDRATEYFKAFSPKSKIIHIDIDPAEINKNVICTVSLNGDARSALEALLPLVKKKERELWIKPETAEKDNNSFDSRSIIRELYRQTKGDAIIVTDVGKHQMTTVTEWKFLKPGTLLTSGGLGTMGYGLGAAIGAKLANPDKLVINIAGDGCFRMNMNELATASRYKVPVIEIILDNHSLGLVKELQDELCEGRHSCTDIEDDVDFVKIAEAMGAKGFRATNLKAFSVAVKDAIKAKVPTVIECEI
ncbi:MAG: biosynthetic-type acetolactate synthase large subunit [Lachnospiraceae bacterium]|nr:biosynthetic-type acetolactate synthase large subunit [Lachnospiraceae bacterium]